MEKIINTTDYLINRFRYKSSAFLVQWKSVQMEDEQFKEVMNQQFRLMRQMKPVLWLEDASKLDYTMLPEQQEWWFSNVVGLFNSLKVQKYAILKPTEFYPALALEQAVVELEMAFGDRVQVFSNTEDALIWLGV
ncbi:hypothetical protein V6R21_06155 [Limibacter armeniacum]|uniref:hypothetical protein n=1 Tax=Limibacter armeniacum TaxID=466084 RepID=UPI002FE60D5D